MEKFKYSEEEARDEASKMTEFVGDKGSKEDYGISEELIDTENNISAFKQEVYKELFFASGVEDAETAIAFYKLKRQEIQENSDLKSKEKLELIRYCDTERIIRIVEDEEEYNKYFKENHNTSMEISFSEGLQNALLKIFSKEHLVLGPNSIFIAPTKNPIMGLPFNAKIDGVKFYDSTNTEVRMDMIITEQNKPNIEHRGSMYIDKKLNKIRSAIIPEGLKVDNPKESVEDLFNLSTIETEAMLAVANLSKRSEYIPRTYQNKRLRSVDLGSPEGTKLREEVKSVLPYRRRTIKDVSKLSSELNDLLNGFNSKERKILENTGGGDVLIDVYDNKRRRVSSSGRSVDSYIPDGFIGSAPSRNIASLESLVSTAIYNQGKAIILPRGEWIPPLLLGTPKRPHTRRVGGRVCLYIGGTVPEKEKDEIQRIWRKRKTGHLQKDEANKLNDLFENNLPQDVVADLELSNGIHYKDGRFVSSTAEEDHEQVYIR